MANSPVTHIVIHYSATPRGRHITVADIDAWHKARGWKGIGYHYVIYLDGSVHKGRPDNVVGAHVAGHNTGTIGICYIGGVDGDPNKGVDTRTPEQTRAMIALIRDLLAKYPGAEVVGHRDMPDAATQCPGFNATTWWASVTRQPAPPVRPVPADAPVRTPNVTEDPTPPARNTAGEVTGIAATIAVTGAAAWEILGWVGLATVLVAAGALAWLFIRRRKAR